MNEAKVMLVGPEQEENLALRYLAASLEANGISWRIAPCDTSKDMDDVLSKISRWHPDIVGISLAFQVRAPEMLELVRRIRELAPYCHIVAGGHFASLRARELLADFPALDSVICFEGEESLCALVRALRDGCDLDTVPNLVFRKNDGRIAENEARSSFPDLDRLPWPARPDSPERHLGIRMAHVLGSRGCYHSSCRYCCIAAFHRAKKGARYALRSPGSIAAEMKELWGRGVRIFFFHDDNFFLKDEDQSLARLAQLGEAFKAAGIQGARIYVKSRPSTISTRTIEALRALGVGGLFVGVENHATESSAYLGRNESPEERETALELLKEADLVSCYNMLLFNPKSRPEDILSNLSFAEDKIEIPFNFCRVEVYAGTPLEAELLKDGRLEGSYLGWDYRIEDERVERMARWCRSFFAMRRFNYRGLVNQNITLGYHSDIATHFFPGEIAVKLKLKVRRLSREVNADTIRHLKALFELSMDESLGDARRAELAAGIGESIAESDGRLTARLLSLRRDLGVYAHVCSWAERLRLANSAGMSGPLFEKLFRVADESAS